MNIICIHSLNVKDCDFPASNVWSPEGPRIFYLYFLVFFSTGTGSASRLPWSSVFNGSNMSFRSLGEMSPPLHDPLPDGFDMFPAIKMVKLGAIAVNWHGTVHPIPGGIVGKSEAQGFCTIFPQRSIHPIDWMYVQLCSYIFICWLSNITVWNLKWSIPTWLIVKSRHIQHLWSPAFLMAPLISMSKDGPPAAPRYLSDEDSDGDFRRLSAWTVVWRMDCEGGLRDSWLVHCFNFFFTVYSVLFNENGSNATQQWLNMFNSGWDLRKRWGLQIAQKPEKCEYSNQLQTFHDLSVSLFLGLCQWELIEIVGLYLELIGPPPPCS